MKSLVYQFLSFLFILGLASCGGNSGESDESGNEADSSVTSENATVEKVDLSAAGIHIYEADIAKEFPNAKLSLSSPTLDQVTAAGNYNFSFAVQDYELATQTEGADMRHCANSAKGQHIHFIVNNGPYAAHYEPEFEGEMVEGNNVVLAFLSRSYHESIKNGTAFILNNYVIGEVEDEFDETAEHLFYSRPKGTYSGKDAEKILLDFYLINANLSAEGYKVRATINDTEFILPKWAPYFVEGLPMGKNTIRLELIDAMGELVEGPFNDSGVREITLEESTES